MGHKVWVPARRLGAQHLLTSRCRASRAFVVKHFLPLSFAVATVWALAWPTPGKFLVELMVSGKHVDWVRCTTW
jgi:hypothetical protein